ncbi:hypothetical protein RUM43_008805 [Polyplax serrata]|uniref:Uncharacterized protein n=1 Tax=Polyplax serrata TaxID=468196 RepID=A0AAN8S1K8_POLSC
MGLGSARLINPEAEIPVFCVYWVVANRMQRLTFALFWFQDYAENHGSESSLETESFLRTTESVVAAMQNRMRLSQDGKGSSEIRKVEKKEFSHKEKPHPPSTASDTDTNSDTDVKNFKKPIGNPFTSARLNRAFSSLRRAKADPDNEFGGRKKSVSGGKDTNSGINVKSTSSPKPIQSKPPSTPFSRTDCGRFSMRSTVSSIRNAVVDELSQDKVPEKMNRTDESQILLPKLIPELADFKLDSLVRDERGCQVDATKKNLLCALVTHVSYDQSNTSNQSQKKDVKKQNSSNRSASSLSSREVEFQNWRRRKSFDPMKAAAEGRKKELAKKAAMNQTMTQSANLGNGTRSRGGLNPVLRSASFHSTAQVFGADDDDREEFQDQGSTDDQEESAASSWASNHRSLLYNSPTQGCTRCSLVSRAVVCTSRSSLISETHSSPSRRLRSDDLDSLVMTAISDLSYKLKLKLCNLLKKLDYLYDPNDEKSYKLRSEIKFLETRRNSAKNSPIHQAASRDLSATLKNLKDLENVLKVLDDVLFEENFEIFVE